MCVLRYFAGRAWSIAMLITDDCFREIQDFDRVKAALKSYYKVNLEHREHALKGWNWGKAEFSKQELHFNVANKPAFEIPFSEVSNSNLAGKNEIAVEFATTENLVGGRTKKNTAAVDQLVEMRFYVPGTAKRGEGEDGASDAEGEDMSAATLFYDTLKEKADIGEIAGDTFATFLDILFLTPRYFLFILFCLGAGTKQCFQRSLRYRHVRVILPSAW